MKRFIVFIFLLIIFAVCTLDFGNKKVLGHYFSDCETTYYCESVKENYESNYKIIKNGDGVIAVGINQWEYEGLLNVSGYSVSSLIDNCRLDNLLADIRVLKSEIVGGVSIYYGYLCGLPYFCFIDGKKINIQIAVNNGNVVVGSPLIFGSY